MKNIIKIIAIALLLTSCSAMDFDDFLEKVGLDDLVEEETTVPQAPSAPVLQNPTNCDLIRTNDGRGGFLFLGHSESNGLPVGLLPGQWQGPSNMLAERTDGSTETLQDRNFGNPDGSAGGLERRHFRATRSCSSYTGKLTVINGENTAHRCEVRVRSCERND